VDKKYYVVMQSKSTKLYAYFFGSMMCWTDCKNLAHQFDVDRADQWVENLKGSGDEDFYKEECKVNTENNSTKFRVIDSYGEIDFVSEKNVIETIHKAWNYEADVYVIEPDGSLGACIFHGWEENEILSGWLKPYDLRVIDRGRERYLQSVSTREIHVASWQGAVN